MARKPDIVSELLEMVLSMASRGDGCFTDSMALQVEKQIRLQYGGCEIYIKQEGAMIEHKKRAAMKAVSEGKSPAEAGKENGLSRRTIYRMLQGEE